MKTKRCLTTTVAFILCGLLLSRAARLTPEKQAVVQKKKIFPARP